MIKFVLVVSLLGGGTKDFATFDSELEAQCYKTRLYEWNKNKGYGLLRNRGFDVPKTWAEYNKKVFITTK